MKKLILCSVWLIISFMSQAQDTVTLQGIIRNLNTGNTIPAVTITNSSNAQTILSDESGKFSFSTTLPTVLTFSRSGYFEHSLTISSYTKPIEISLEEKATELSEIVISADHQDENLGANNVSKITLQLSPIKSAHDLLKTVPGLFIAQHAGGGKAEQIFLRGFDNDHGTDFAVNVDDIPVNLSSHAHGQGYADLHFLIPETVKDANYYKGPHEASLGNFAVSGAANYTTKDRLSSNLVKLEYGQYDFIRALAMISILDEKNFLTKNDESAYIAIEGTFNRSFFESDQDLRRLNTFTKYAIDINQTNTLVTSVSTFHSDWNASGQIPLRAVESGLIDRFGAIDDQEGGDTERIHINTQLTSELSENTTLKNQLYYVSNTYNLFSNFTFFQNDPVNGDMIHQYEDRNIFAYNGSIGMKDFLGIPKSKTTIGWTIQHHDNTIGLNNAIGRDLLSVVNIFDIKETSYSLYLKERIKIAPKLTALAGLRTDYFTFDQNEIVPSNTRSDRDAIQWSPKLSLFYDISPKVQLYAKASSGFHSNYTQAAVRNSAVNPLPKATGYDLGTEFKIGKSLVGNITAWYLQSDAEFVFGSDGFEFEDKGRSERIGGEASFRYQPLPYFWLDTDLNYSYGTLLDAPDDENKIPSAPRFSSTGGATVRLENGIRGSLRYRYLGERPLIEDESVTAQDYFIMDAVINYRKPSYEIGLSIENIFDQKWREAVFYDSSQLQGEAAPVDDVHFTPGTPFLAKLSFTYFF